MDFTVGGSPGPWAWGGAVRASEALGVSFFPPIMCSTLWLLLPGPARRTRLPAAGVSEGEPSHQKCGKWGFPSPEVPSLHVVSCTGRSRPGTGGQEPGSGPADMCAGHCPRMTRGDTHVPARAPRRPAPGPAARSAWPGMNHSLPCTLSRSLSLGELD